jgi:excisionase family DNA binding protein
MAALVEEGGHLTQTTLRPLLTPDQVAATVAKSRRSVYRLHQCGELPAVRVGGVLRFRAEDVRKYILRQRTGGAVA